MAIKIVTDSVADLPAELVQDLDITVVPCNVVLGDVNYKDGVDLGPDELYRRMAAGPGLPTTSQPSMAEFQSVYQELTANGDSIVSIHPSAKVSGTFNSAQQARNSLGDADIHVIDSGMASIAEGLTVLTAAQLAKEAGSAEEVASQVQAGLSKTHAFFLLDTLEYLQKGGRIGKAQAFLGGVLSVKPILGMQDGEVHPVERPRSRQRGIRRLRELAVQMAPVRQMAVIYSTELQEAEDLKQGFSDLLPDDQIITARFGSALGVYVGPHAVGVALTQA